jgi:hypothetical protein
MPVAIKAMQGPAAPGLHLGGEREFVVFFRQAPALALDGAANRDAPHHGGCEHQSFDHGVLQSKKPLPRWEGL